MSDTLVIALVVAFTSALSPIVLAVFTASQRRAEKIEDYRRQDEVAARLLTATTRMTEETVKTNEQLVVIHTLVNSNMTAAMQTGYDSVVRELVLMKEVIKLHEKDGREVSQEAHDEVVRTEGKIIELRAALDERLKQASEAAEQKIAAAALQTAVTMEKVLATDEKTKLDREKEMLQK